MSIEVQHVAKTFGDFTALHDLSLTIPDGRLVAILGPSGCGKTTLLRIIAGLEMPDPRPKTDIRFDGVSVLDSPVNRRRVGFVFQHYALFRQMTVAENVAFGGARRDEEKSRAKERIFSFRDAFQQWDPKNQRPELWDLYNGRINPGESVRCFPLSNWTETDVWQYIRLEKIPLPSLYFAKPRPVVERDGTLIMVDDDRMRLNPGEVPQMRTVRFRTLGCYPLTGAVESTATTVEEIVAEMLQRRLSERSTRVIDRDGDASMEQKKREGYF